jgi:hypothetical protein
VAKRFLDDYYQKLALQTEMRQSQLQNGGASSGGRRRGRGSKSNSKRRRSVSFNQAELQRHKTKGGMGGELGRETRTHIRRMSVDVGLFLGQKGLQVRSARRRGSSEPSPTQSTPVTKETEISGGGAGNKVAAGGEREKGESSLQLVEEKKENAKHGRKKKGSKKLKRSSRLGSTEEDDVISEGSSQTQVPPPSSQMPPPKSRQGRFRRSLRKTSSQESAGMADSGSMVSIVGVKDKPGPGGSGASGGGGGKTEKKSRFGIPFPGRRWSWRHRKTERESEAVTRDNDLQQQCSIREEDGGAKFENPVNVEDLLSSNSPTSMAQTGDSWPGNAPNRAFSPAPNKTHNKLFIGTQTRDQSFTEQTAL